MPAQMMPGAPTGNEMRLGVHVTLTNPQSRTAPFSLVEEFAMSGGLEPEPHPLSADTVTKDLARLARLSRFETISVEAAVQRTQTGDTVLLTYRFHPTPIIKDVEVTGNNQISTRDISAEVSILAGTPVDSFQLDRARRRIVQPYPRQTRKGLQRRQQRGIHKHHLVLGVVGDIHNLIGKQANIQRMQHAARAWRAEVDLQEAIGVPGEGRHPAIWADVEPIQRVGQSRGALDHVGVGVAVHAGCRFGGNLLARRQLPHALQEVGQRQRVVHQ